MDGRLSLLLIAVLLSMSAGRLHRQKEGEECQTRYGKLGICTMARKCPGIITETRNGFKLIKMCSYGKRGPIVCCSANALEKKAVAKCVEYGKYSYTWTYSNALSLITEKTKEKTCYIIGEQLIFGGEKAEPREFPHMAALAFEKIKGQPMRWVCGGSLISEQFILTAAHCTSERRPVTWARLGDINLERDDDDNESQMLRVVSFINHPSYRPPCKYHDIALLKLERAAVLGSYVRPACLYTQHQIQSIDKVTATGWGYTEKNTETSPDLLKVKLSVEKYETCRSTIGIIPGWLVLGVKEDSMICAGYQGGKDTCMGDSGGPLQIRLETPYCMYGIVGVTSFGGECGQPNVSSIYTRVSRYVPWIVSVVWP